MRCDQYIVAGSVPAHARQHCAERRADESRDGSLAIVRLVAGHYACPPSARA